MSKLRIVRALAMAAVVIVFLALGAAPAQAAAPSWVTAMTAVTAAFWPAGFPAFSWNKPARPSSGKPDSRKAGGCVDPDGRTVTSPGYCSSLETNSPDGGAGSNG